MKAAAYLRVSTESQIDNWSLPAQRRELENYCNQKKDWQLIRIYSEEGISAHSDSIDKRPQFRRLLDDCKKGEIDVILVHSLDRWSRNLRVTLESFKILSENRIAFVSITENIDYSSPEGRLFLAMLGAFAQYFSDSLSKHTTKGMKQRAISGYHNGDVPFGYERCSANCPSDHKNKVHLVITEAKAVEKLFQLYASGRWSLSRLADWLNQQGFKTRNKGQVRLLDGSVVKGPRPFTLYSIRWLLHNQFFVGKIIYHGESYNGVHEPIINEKLFSRVQEKLKKHRSRSTIISTSFRLYLLKGIARCIYCGYPLWSDTAVAGYTYYREKKNSHAVLKCPANGKAIRCNFIDNQIDAMIESIILDPAWKEHIISKLSNLSNHDQILKQRKQIVEKLRRLGKAYVDGILNDGEYTVQRKLLQNNLESLVEPDTDATINAGELLETMGIIWEKATLEEKHDLLTTMLEAVYIDLAATRSIVGIQPKPAFYALFESLKQKPDSKVTIFNPDDSFTKIKTDSAQDRESDFGLVEAREGRTPRPEKSCQNFYRHSRHFNLTWSASVDGVKPGQPIKT